MMLAKNNPDKGICTAIYTLRYGDKCMECGKSGKLYFLHDKNSVRCRLCNKERALLTGTIFGGTNTSLTEWLKVNRMLLTSPGISLNRVAFKLGTRLSNSTFVQSAYRRLNTLTLRERQMLDEIYTDWLREHPDIE